MSKFTHQEAEEDFCTCGAGYGSLEGHVEWCKWHRIAPMMDALQDALNWFTPPNDSRTPFPVKEIAEALEIANGEALKEGGAA